MLLWLLCYEPRYFGTISRSNLGTLGYFGAALWSLVVGAGAARWLGIIVLYYPNSAMLHAATSKITKFLDLGAQKHCPRTSRGKPVYVSQCIHKVMAYDDSNLLYSSLIPAAAWYPINWYPLIT